MPYGNVPAGGADHTQEHRDVATALDARQPLDSDLTAIAALTTTAYGRSLLTLANQAALQTEAGGGGGGAPSGPAGGDLAGTYPDPTVQNDSHSHTSSTVTPAGIGAQTDVSLRRLTRTLTPTEVKAASTPIELIAAPGAGYWINVMWIVETMKYTAPIYGVSGTAVLRIGTTTLLSVAAQIINSASIGLSQPPASLYTFLTAFENQPVQFYTSVNPTNGNSNITYDLWYTINAVPA